jgi:TonB family protein
MRRLAALLMAVAMSSGGAKAQTTDHPLQVGGQVKAPVAIYTPMPQFPKGALTGNPATQFMVSLVVDQQGLPQKVRMFKGMSEERDKYALDAVRKYRFKPATLDGQAVAVELKIEVNIDFW